MSCTVNEILINSITVTTKFIHAIFKMTSHNKADSDI